jgi:succinate dehydrogenase / fumarate reductase membrane anchor subunit
VALVVLTLWFACALLALDDYSHASVIAWMGAPFNAVMLVLTVAIAAYHSQLGVQVVVEDYVQAPWLKVATLLLLNFVHVVFAAVGILAVLNVALA